MTDDDSGLRDALDALARGEDLGPRRADAALEAILSGAATPAQVGAFLLGLRAKGETVDEIAGLVRAMRRAAVPLRSSREGLVDLCGTGGDGSGTFNLSTAAALVVAACGVPVAKHGNRSASSRCGSADLLEASGIPIDHGPEVAARSLEEHGFCFLYARSYHPAMRHVAGPRRELGIRTVFNLLGPMTSPAEVRRQLLGVYDDALRPVVARVLGDLGSERVWVVHGEGGLDELSVAGSTRITVLEDDGLREIEIAPEDAGLTRHDPSRLAGGDARRNAGILAAVLRGERGAYRDATLLNAAAALVVQGAAADLREGARRAAEAVDSGAARGLLDRLRGTS